MSWAVPQSRCSAGNDLEFVWFDGSNAEVVDHINAVVAEFDAVMHVHGRLWNPYHLAMTKSEFKKRVELAAEGRLIPVDEVADIPRAHGEHLFEIRWECNVLELDVGGSKSYRHIQVRLYHSEPNELPMAFVGLNLHEKKTVGTQAQINHAQDVEINVAIGRFMTGIPTLWGTK